MTKLLPVTYVVLLLLVGVFGLPPLYLDIVKPTEHQVARRGRRLEP